MTEWRVPPKARYRLLGAILFAVFLLCGSVWAAGGEAPAGAANLEFVPVENIAPQQGKEFLDRLGIGTVSVMPNTDALLVTGTPDELQKAVVVLNLIDTRTAFDIQELGPASAAQALPSNDRIAAAVGGLSIGTFARPVLDRSKMRAIIDVHHGKVVAIAPVFQLQDIRIAVELGPEVLKGRRALAAPMTVEAANATLQATVMAEPVSVRSSGGAETPPAIQSDTAAPRKFVLPPEMKKKLDELRQRRAAELRTQYQAAPQPEPPAVEPAPAPVAELPRVTSDLALAQSNPPAAEPPVPTEPSEADTPPQETLVTEDAAEPAPEEPASLQPGEVVPAAPTEITPTPAEPQPAQATATTSPPSDLEPAAPPNGDRVVDLTLPEKLPVIQLLDLVAKYYKLDLIYDPAKITGDVTLRLNGDLRGSVLVRNLYPLLESVLKFKGFVTTRHRGNIVTIVPAAEALDADPVLLTSDSEGIEAGNVVVTRVFELKYVDTASATNLLESMRLSVGTMPIADRHMLIVTAYAHRMERVEELLRLVDRPGEPRKFRFRQLHYTMAETLATKVKALAEQLESVTVTVGEAEPTINTQKLPNETDTQYRTRLAQIRAAQAAAARARAAATGQTPPEPKPGVYLDADERTNRILMIGVEDQLAIVEELIDTLDVQQQDLRALQLYRMKHVDAEEVARKLQELRIISRLPETPASSTRITGGARTPTQVPGQPRVPGAPTPEVPGSTSTELTAEGLVGEPQVVVVESTNSLLVNATPEQHAKITAIIEYVDSKALLDEIPYKIYPLDNSSPSHLAEILEGLIQETVEQEKDGKIEKTVVNREERIQIVPDPNTYSLIVYANKTNQDWIANLIEQLDKRRPQVLIDVTLVEITKTEAFNYDLNLIQSFPNLAATSGVIDVITTPADLAAAGRSHFLDLQSQSGVFTGYYADRHINALLEAMQTKNYGRVLAKPKLLANDNELGTIRTADITYVQKTSSIPVTSGTAGDQSTLIQTAVDYEPYEAGITLNITPHISEGDLLRLNIELTRSDFRETENPEKPPNTTESEVKTAVTVPDGGTIILGGMLKLNQNKGGGKVPILGDLPLVGGLFRSIKNSDIQSKLYVFVKAEIIRPTEGLAQAMKELEDISERNRMAFERNELEFQSHQDWPGIKPTPVPPAKVLEAE